MKEEITGGNEVGIVSTDSREVGIIGKVCVGRIELTGGFTKDETENIDEITNWDKVEVDRTDSGLIEQDDEITGCDELEYRGGTTGCDKVEVDGFKEGKVKLEGGITGCKE